MLNRLKSKRGAVMESALLFLLVIFLLCFLLTLVALSGHASTKLARTKLENRLALEQIAEDFITYAKENPDDPTAFVNENETYEAAVTEAGKICGVRHAVTAAAVLNSRKLADGTFEFELFYFNRSLWRCSYELKKSLKNL